MTETNNVESIRAKQAVLSNEGIRIRELKVNRIYQGNSLDVIKDLPDESVHMCITSPPYWALRDYGVEGQLGLEPTFDKYIQKLCKIFDEVKRVLKKEGTCWVNLGDTYSRGSRRKDGTEHSVSRRQNNTAEPSFDVNYTEADKCLLQIPSRFAIEMTNRGWILRNTIIWHKPNCMPASVKDRFTVDFEYLFFFSKNKKYHFEPQYEPWADGRMGRDSSIQASQRNRGGRTDDFTKPNGIDPSHNPGRHKRCVWSITTKPFAEAHFAVYPPELIETPIKAGCPEFVCKKCGKARERTYEPTGNYIGQGGYGSKTAVHIGASPTSSLLTKQVQEKAFVGYTDCGCNAGFEPGIVLDPFMGSGTTALVALKQYKRFVGIELNPSYIEIAYKRIKPLLEQSNLCDLAA